MLEGEGVETLKWAESKLKMSKRSTLTRWVFVTITARHVVSQQQSLAGDHRNGSTVWDCSVDPDITFIRVGHRTYCNASTRLNVWSDVIPYDEIYNGSKTTKILQQQDHGSKGSA
jgi:hypothetical protein